jgi:hypothetical protein
MRHLTGYSIAFLLTILLASTTPIGTGSGVHEFDMLHPLFTHMHLVNGRLLTHEQMDQEATLARALASEQLPTHGPSLGSGSAGTPDGGLGISPTLPSLSATVMLALPVGWLNTDVRLPRGRVEAPPVPPPLTRP